MESQGEGHGTHGGHSHLQHPHKLGHQAIDRGFTVIVRMVLWIVAGAVFLGFALWWVLT